MTVFEDLCELASCFFRDLTLATHLKSGNAEDDLAIKMSIIGFSYHSDTQAWDKGHYEFVIARLNRDYCHEELANYGDNSLNLKLFYATCLGYLLGLHHQGKLDDANFQQAERQIPGIIMYYLPQLTGRAG